MNMAYEGSWCSASLPPPIWLLLWSKAGGPETDVLFEFDRSGVDPHTNLSLLNILIG
ncbi:unnamed protein product [Musa acuminata var. zebrina]